jgi:hypothetical protein
MVALLVSGCRLASAPSPTAELTQPGSTPSISASPSAGGISEEEAVEIATEARLNPDTVMESVASGPFVEAAPEDFDDPRIDPEQPVWVVTFAGDVNVGCEFSDCPIPGTETVIVDLSNGEVLGYAVIGQ